MATTAQERAARDTISNILMSESCQKIDFWWGPYHIDGWGYTAIALALLAREGTPNRLSIRVGGIPADADATYDSDTNIVRLPSWTYATVDPFQRMGVVHELTHALVDMIRRGPRILYSSNEVLAFSAEAMFNANEADAGRPSWTAPAGSLYAQAAAFAAPLRTQPGAILGPYSAIQDFVRAMANSSTYSFLRRRPDTMTVLSGVPL